MSVKIVDNMPAFRRALEFVGEDAIREGARDGFIKAKMNAPFKKGGLRSEADFRRVGRLTQRITFWKEYAAYQERGRRRNGRNVVRNYTTSGTGAHFLEYAGDEQANKLLFTLKKHLGRL